MTTLLRPFAHTALLVGALLLAACGDNGTSPLPAPHLELSVGSISQPFMWTTPEGDPVVKCEVTFHVVSNGTDKARWSRGLLRWYVGKDRSAPVDSSAISGEDLQAFFDMGELPVGTSADAPMEITAGIPFGGALDIAYMGTRDSKERHAVAPFTCGPESTPGATPPAVTVSVVTPETEVLEPGDTIVLHLTSTSNVGLWRTLVGISGPCETHQLFNEQLAPSVARDVRLVLPASCSFNAPISVTGAALDALGVETDVSVPTTRFIVDRTPPTLNVFATAAVAGAPQQSGLAGAEYFGDDSIRIGITASDNHELRAIVWEVEPAGFRDSLLVFDQSTLTRWVAMRARPEWGRFQIRIFARDAKGLESAVTSSAVDAFVAYPSTTLPLKTVQSVGRSRLVSDPVAGRLYVVSDYAVTTHSLTTLAVERSLNIPITVSSADLLAGGDTLFMTQSNGVGVAMLDLGAATPELKMIQRSDGGAWGAPSTVLTLANGKIFVVDVNAGVIEIDRATLATTPRGDATAHWYAVRAHDGGSFFVAGEDGNGVRCVQRYDAATDRFSPCVATDYAPGSGISTDMSGERLALGYRVYDASMALVRAMTSPNAALVQTPPPVLLSADGTQLYMPYGSGVVRERVSDGAIIDRIAGPGFVNSMSLADDGSALFVLDIYGRLTRIALR